MILKLPFFFIVFVMMSVCASSPPSPNLISDSHETTGSNHSPSPTITPGLPKNVETNAKLQLKANSFLKLFGNMPSVPIFIKDEPIIKTGSETQRGVAYTTCANKKDPTIFVKKVFYERANEKQLANILKHELVHAWFCRQGEIIGHDERFRKKFKEIGGFGN